MRIFIGWGLCGKLSWYLIEFCRCVLGSIIFSGFIKFVVIVNFMYNYVKMVYCVWFFDLIVGVGI